MVVLTLAILFVLCLVGTVIGLAAGPILERCAETWRTASFRLFVTALVWPIALAISFGEFLADLIRDGLSS